MSEEMNPAEERRQVMWGFGIVALVLAVLVGAFLLFGLPGVGITMVAATPIMYVILVVLSVGG